jgi:hypothetical protein
LYEALKKAAAGEMRLEQIDLSQYALAGTWRISLYMSLLLKRAVKRGHRMIPVLSDGMNG